ncbi:hypothetical protein TNCV_1146051 [Trichonephila clavipes]|nr:hypothetical protein TNCV_1146051 [Trichonephila clavipes]
MGCSQPLRKITYQLFRPEGGKYTQPQLIPNRCAATGMKAAMTVWSWSRTCSPCCFFRILEPLMTRYVERLMHVKSVEELEVLSLLWRRS